MSVTYSFSPNTRIKSSEANQDFTDCVSKYTMGSTYTPTLYRNDGVTVWATTTLNYSRYGLQGDRIWWDLTITPETGVNNGVAGFITLPSAARLDATYSRLAGACMMTATGTDSGWPVYAILNPAGTRIVVYFSSVYATENTWADPANPVIYGHFEWEAA